MVRTIIPVSILMAWMLIPSAVPACAAGARDRIIVAETASQDVVEKETATVLRECKSKLTPLWNCDCVVSAFRKAKAAAPAKDYNSILYDDKIYQKCFDRAQTEAYCTKYCNTAPVFRMEAGQGRHYDCACYTKVCADKLIDAKVSDWKKLGQLQAAAMKECRVK